MYSLLSIGRAGAVAGLDSASSPFGAHRTGGVSFSKSFQVIIGASAADHQRYYGGSHITKMNQQNAPSAKDVVVSGMVGGGSTLQRADKPAAGQTNPNAASSYATQLLQSPTEQQSQTGVNYGYGTPGGYQFDTAPSTLDPGSMAFLLAWMGGSSDGQSIQQQQQSYLETYRQRYPNGVPGVNNYTTAASNYLTGTRY
jgi:hypothetical protein